MTKSRKVIVITLNFNQNEFTFKCIESLLDSDYPNFLVLLIDNGSTSENFQNLKVNLPIDNRLVLKRIEKNCGYVGGVNYGLSQGELYNTDYFLVMNNDTIIESCALTELVKTCSQYNDRAIVSGKVYHFDKPQMLQDVGYKFSNREMLLFTRLASDEIDKGQFDKVEHRDLLDDVFWLFPVGLYKEIKGYSSYFWFNAEQADFALRAKKVGYSLVYTPHAKLWHKGSLSIGGRLMNPRLSYYHIQSTLIFHHLHLSFFRQLLFSSKILYEILRGYLKFLLYKPTPKQFTIDYPNSKLYGFIYYIRWIIRRNENSGYNPFND